MNTYYVSFFASVRGQWGEKNTTFGSVYADARGVTEELIKDITAHVRKSVADKVCMSDPDINITIVSLTKLDK